MMYHTMHELRQLIKNQNWDTINTHQYGWSTPHIVVVLTSIPLVEQVKLIRVLDKSRTLDVFKRLKLTEQAQVLRAMERNEAVRLLEELDPQLRARLADAIPAKPNRRPLVPLKLQAVWSIFA